MEKGKIKLSAEINNLFEVEREYKFPLGGGFKNNQKEIRRQLGIMNSLINKKLGYKDTIEFIEVGGKKLKPINFYDDDFKANRLNIKNHLEPYFRGSYKTALFEMTKEEPKYSTGKSFVEVKRRSNTANKDSVGKRLMRNFDKGAERLARWVEVKAKIKIIEKTLNFLVKEEILKEEDILFLDLYYNRKDNTPECFMNFKNMLVSIIKLTHKGWESGLNQEELKELAKTYKQVNFRRSLLKLGLNERDIKIINAIIKKCIRLDSEWVEYKIQELKEDTGLSKENQNKSIKKLAKIGLLEKELKGLPAKRNFKISPKSLSNSG